MNVFVSSNAIGNDISDVVRIGKQYCLPIEFSSNIKYSESNIDEFRNYKLLKTTHNYFPASRTPFVFNLASLDSHVNKMTLELCMKNIEIASETITPIYSCHAGFALDPKAKSLGGSFLFDVRDHDKYYDCFLTNLEKVLRYADKLGVTLLIENNVTIPQNYQNFYSPLFCSSFEEILLLAQKFETPNFGILFDTAHYKVSSNSFHEEHLDISLLYPHIKGLHHSDNDGLVDSNEVLEQDYWWFRETRNLPNILFEVLEIKKSSIETINRQVDFIKNRVL